MSKKEESILVNAPPLGVCCQRGSRQPCNRIQSRNRTAAIDYGYIDDSRQREQNRCCCKQALRCACPPRKVRLYRLDIPQLPLNKTYCFPAALTALTPCSRFGYNQASAGDNTMFPARYPTREQQMCL